MTTPDNGTVPDAAENPITSTELDAEAERKAKASERARKAAATRARNAAAKATGDAEAPAADATDAAATDAAPAIADLAAEPVAAEPAVSEPVAAEAAAESIAAEPAVAEATPAETTELFPEATAVDYGAAPVASRQATSKQRTLVVRILVAVFTVILVPLGFSLVFQGGYPIYGMFAQGYETPPEASSVLLIVLGAIALVLPVIATAWSSLGMYIIGGILTVAGAIGIFSFDFFWKTYEVLAQAGIGEFVTVMTILTLSSGLGFAFGLICIAFGVAATLVRRRRVVVAEPEFDEFDDVNSLDEAFDEASIPAEPALPTARA